MTTVVQPSGGTRDSVLSTRIANVYHEGRKIGIVLSPEVCRILAGQPYGLEELGELVQKVVGTIRDRNQPLTPEAVVQVLQERPKSKSTQIPPIEVLEAVTEHFHITVQELQGPSRQEYLIVARQAAMLFLRDLSGLSSTKVGERLGRDHSTVLSGQKTAEERRDGDARFWQDLEDIKARLLRA